MSIYEKVVIVVIRFVSIFWFLYSLWTYGTMALFGSIALTGFTQIGMRLTPIFLLSLLIPLALYFAARILARIITAGID